MRRDGLVQDLLSGKVSVQSKKQRQAIKESTQLDEMGPGRGGVNMAKMLDTDTLRQMIKTLKNGSPEDKKDERNFKQMIKDLTAELQDRGLKESAGQKAIQNIKSRGKKEASFKDMTDDQLKKTLADYKKAPKDESGHHAQDMATIMKIMKDRGLKEEKKHLSESDANAKKVIDQLKKAGFKEELPFVVSMTAAKADRIIKSVLDSDWHKVTIRGTDVQTYANNKMNLKMSITTKGGVKEVHVYPASE